MNGQKKTRLRFTYKDDLILLREVTLKNPFSQPTAWNDVKVAVCTLIQKEFSLKTIRQHVQMLLEQWLQKEEESRNEILPGVEEPYCEKDILLQQIYDMQKNSKVKKQNKKLENETTKVAISNENTKDISPINHLDTNYETDEMEVVEVKEILVEDNIDPKTKQAPTPEAATSKTPKNILKASRIRARRRGLEYIKEKNLRNHELEVEKLKIEERKVAVAERQIALAEKKFLFESEQQQKIFDSQQKIINKLLGIIDNLNVKR